MLHIMLQQLLCIDTDRCLQIRICNVVERCIELLAIVGSVVNGSQMDGKLSDCFLKLCDGRFCRSLRCGSCSTGEAINGNAKFICYK